MPPKGYKLSEEQKLRIKDGMRKSPLVKMNLDKLNKLHEEILSDENRSLEYRRKISTALKGRKKKPFSEEHKRNISLSALGRIPYNKGVPNTRWIGKGNPNWKDGISSDLTHYRRQRKSLERGAKGFHTIEEWNTTKLLFNNACACCHREEPNIKLTEDHIVPLTRHGTNCIDNIQPLCTSCNSKKKNKVIRFIPSSTTKVERVKNGKKEEDK